MHPNFTYGELCPGQLKKILNSCSLQGIKEFWDLGSGKGDVCQQALETRMFQHIHGLEFLPERLAISLKNRHKNIKYCWANLYNPLKKPPTKAMAYLCATCFEHSLLTKISQSLTEHENFKICASLKPMPLCSESWNLPNIVTVSCSWDDALCYIYHRKN